MSTPAFNIGQLVESLLPIGIIFGLQALKLDYADPAVLLAFRAIFAVSVAIFLGLCFFLQTKIKAKKATLDAQRVTYEKPMGMSQKMAAMNEQAQLKASGQDVPAAKDTITVTETVFEYDLSQLKELAKSGLISYAMSAAIHAYGGYTQPIILTAILSLRRFTKSPLFSLHILNQDSVGELARPFKAEPSMLASLMPTPPAADAAPTGAAAAAPRVKKSNK